MMVDENEQLITLTMDLDPLSPLLDTLISSPDNHMASDSLPFPSQLDILMDNRNNRQFVENEDELENKINEEDFKKELIAWLRENNLKLTPANELKTKGIIKKEKEVGNRGNYNYLLLGSFGPTLRY